MDGFNRFANMLIMQCLQPSRKLPLLPRDPRAQYLDKKDICEMLAYEIRAKLV